MRDDPELRSKLEQAEHRKSHHMAEEVEKAAQGAKRARFGATEVIPGDAAAPSMEVDPGTAGSAAGSPSTAASSTAPFGSASSSSSAPPLASPTVSSTIPVALSTSS